jgi:hypothetical protein
VEKLFDHGEKTPPTERKSIDKAIPGRSFGAMTSARGAWLLLFLAVLEPLSRWFGGWWAPVAAWPWLALGIGATVGGLALLAGDTLRALRLRAPTAVLGTVAVCFTGFFGIAGYAHCGLNFESAQQMTAGLAGLKQPDLGYHALGFIMYPARQYTLTALPAEVFGPSLLALRLGYALCFVAGWAVFRHGLSLPLESQGRTQREAADTAGLFAQLILISPLALHWVRSFEQTMLPLAFALSTLGWAMRWWAKRDLLSLLFFGWSAAMLGTSYSPSLAAWALGLVAIGYLLLPHNPWTNRQPGMRLPLAAVGGYALSCGLVCQIPLRAVTAERFSLAGDVGGPAMLSSTEIFQRITEGFIGLFADTRTPFVHSLLLWPLLGMALWVIVTPRVRSSWLTYGLLSWFVACIVAAVVFRGYVRHPPAFDLYRALVIFPVLVLCLIAAGGNWVARWPMTARLLTALLFLAVTVKHVATTKDTWGFEPYEPHLAEDIVAATGRFLEETQGEGTVYVDGGIFEAGSLDCFVKYFSPRANTVFFSDPLLEIPPDAATASLVFLTAKNSARAAWEAKGHDLRPLEGIAAPRLTAPEVVVARVEPSGSARVTCP